MTDSLQGIYEQRRAIQQRAQDLDALRREVLDWQAQTFTARTFASITAHLAREAVELRDDPDDGSEHADAMMLLWAAVDELQRLQEAHGIDVLEVVRAKLARNRLRTWGEPDADGVVSHTAEGDEDDEDEGCPKGDPDCLSRDDECHDACEAPCDHSMGYRTHQGMRFCQTCGERWELVAPAP
jgi:hypothetical protein